MAARTIILTGERGVGKSTVCLRTVELAQAAGYACGGILTLSQPDGTLATLDVESGETRQLTAPPGADRSVIQGRFRFDPETLAWGNKVLSRARFYQLLTIDELGPLEVERGGGWLKALDMLRRKNFALALVVVRPELVARSQLCLPASAAVVINVTAANRDALPPLLLRLLEKESGLLANGRAVNGPNPDAAVSASPS